jgi:L-serine dehydratase
MLLQDKPKKIEITFEEGGSYAVTYKAQGSDYGFVGGIMGLNIIDENIKTSLDQAKQKGLDVQFVISKATPNRHPNFAKIHVLGDNGSSVTVESNSLGGGIFEITKFDEFPTLIQGACYHILVICNGEEALLKVSGVLLKSGMVADTRTTKGKGQRSLFNVMTEKRLPEEILNEIQNVEGATLKEVFPVLPIVKKKNVQVPFMTAEEAEAHFNGKQLWELACEYEESISGKSREEILAMMKEIANIMRDSAQKALAGNYEKRGFLPPQTPVMAQNLNKSKERYLDLGVLNDALLWSTAMMEYDICRGRVVAAPTGGSCGVIPGAVVCIGDAIGKSEDDIAKALMVCGLIGVFICHQASFGGEVCGCQAEMGSASAMAAAGVVELFGGTPDEAFKAASLSFHNMLGLICDPVAGVGNIPCVSRNATGTSNAVISANMVMNGFDPYIPLSETIDCMWEVGKMMPKEHLCTGTGGLCVTKTGLRVLEELGYY